MPERSAAGRRAFRRIAALQAGIGLFGLVVIPVLCGPCAVAAASQGDVDAAIGRGLAWVAAHPAASRDGGFLDMVDEVLFYSTISRLATGGDHGAGHARRVEDRASRLAESPVFEKRLEKPDKTLSDHYHLLLATHLVEGAGRPMEQRGRVIAQAQRALAGSRYANPTFRLTIALLLRRLGAEPRARMDRLFDASLVSYVARRDALPFIHPLAYYALVHEVAALTDFGRVPASPWLVERREGIARVLRDGMRRAIGTHHIDLLAEMLLCGRMLGLPVTADTRLAVDFLVATQRGDGTWGEQATRRANRRRHAAQTATAALMAYGVSVAESCTSCNNR